MAQNDFLQENAYGVAIGWDRSSLSEFSSEVNGSKKINVQESTAKS